jgi:hypothetical protein
MVSASWGAARASDMILAYRDVQFFKVVELPSQKTTAIEISGLAFHSALAVEKITTDIKGKSLMVEVYLCPARPGLSGSFDYELSIPDSVNEVRFGGEKFVVWRRR